MSASNWDVCLRCRAKAEADREARERRAERAYGKVGRAEYERLCAGAMKPAELPESLREDYEVGVSHTGQFFVAYDCLCQHCGFSHRFRHEQQLDVAPGTEE